MLLVVRALGDGARFGAFVGQRLHRTPHHYGDGESFVFTLSPVAAQYQWAHTPESAALAAAVSCDDDAGVDQDVVQDSELPPPLSSVQAPSVSSANSIFVHSTASLLTIGGSAKSAAAALRIDSDLVRGFSERCDTYNNPALCGAQHDARAGAAGEFEIAELEVFDFVVQR